MPGRVVVHFAMLIGLCVAPLGVTAATPGTPEAAASAVQVAQSNDKASDKANKNKGNKGKDDDKAAERTSQQIVDTLISATERAIIGDYIREAHSSGQGLPPGLANREQLPPGLQKHIARNGTLPPGLAKRELPPDLLSRLPRRPHGQGYRVVGDDVVLIDTATRVILDVMKEVLGN